MNTADTPEGEAPSEPPAPAPDAKKERHPRLINVAKVRALALYLSEQNRAGKFKRVGETFIDRVEARLRNVIADEVQKHPSKGKTLK